MQAILNWSAIAAIPNPMTRAAIMFDRHNPRLQHAFPECFDVVGHDSGKIPWKSWINAHLDPEKITVAEWEWMLSNKDINASLTFLHPSCPEVERVQKDRRLVQSMILPKDHEIWGKKHAEILVFNDREFIVLKVEDGNCALVMSLEEIDMEH
jgi:hypothetical protein